MPGLLVTAILLAALMASPARAATLVYVGNAESNEIHVLQLDRQSGDLTVIEKVAIPGITKPGISTPMAVRPGRRVPFVRTPGQPKLAGGFSFEPSHRRLKHLATGPRADLEEPAIE